MFSLRTRTDIAIRWDSSEPKIRLTYKKRPEDLVNAFVKQVRQVASIQPIERQLRLRWRFFLHSLFRGFLGRFCF